MHIWKNTYVHLEDNALYVYTHEETVWYKMGERVTRRHTVILSKGGTVSTDRIVTVTYPFPRVVKDPNTVINLLQRPVNLAYNVRTWNINETCQDTGKYPTLRHQTTINRQYASIMSRYCQ